MDISTYFGLADLKNINKIRDCYGRIKEAIKTSQELDINNKSDVFILAKNSFAIDHELDSILSLIPSKKVMAAQVKELNKSVEHYIKSLIAVHDEETAILDENHKKEHDLKMQELDKKSQELTEKTSQYLLLIRENDVIIKEKNKEKIAELEKTTQLVHNLRLETEKINKEAKEVYYVALLDSLIDKNDIPDNEYLDYYYKMLTPNQKSTIDMYRKNRK